MLKMGTYGLLRFAFPLFPDAAMIFRPAIGTLAESVSEAAQAATQIAVTSQQQSVGMDQVALAMENIKRASTQTVASTRQAESAAQQLHHLGLKLKQLVELRMKRVHAEGPAADLVPVERLEMSQIENEAVTIDNRTVIDCAWAE